MRGVVRTFQVEVASLHSAALAGLGEAMLDTDPVGAAELATRALKVHPEREFFIDNLLVRIQFIIQIILVHRPCAMGV